MTKSFFTFLCLLSMALGARAQNTLNIHQKDGTVTSYGFAEKPVVTYTETGIHLKTTKVELDFPLANLEKFTFTDGETDAIEEVRTENTSDDVRIYNTNGVLLRTIRQSQGKASFATDDLPRGIYIIKNGETTYKIVKR